ncbi:MAG: phosphotransferase family protein [Acidimicrobiaceae bacterium]|nr:phosphotransferase family protein [Acidimicrobiaceae bacterium]
MSDTVSAGIDAPKVSKWLEANIDDASGPFKFEFIAGGHSNLTFSVFDSRHNHYVLRRPPLSHGLASAHDMGREYRMIAALEDSPVPVPRARGLCNDLEVNGAPFYVMDFVDGYIVRDIATAERVLTEQSRKLASESLVDTLAKIHAVDLTQVGLQDFSRHEGYIARQLKRWYGQWNAQKTRELPVIDRVHEELLKRIPEQGPATIVHGDYRLDNCIVGSQGEICAVLDWEICTLGDPLADLGLLTVYWTGPDDEASPWMSQYTTVKGFLNRSDLITRYAKITGRDISNIEFYRAFAYWKLACIVEGVYARYLGGALGEKQAAELEPFKLQTEAAANSAEVALSRLN